MQNQSQYLPPLTGIRALAAFLVLGLHAEQNVPVGLELIFPFFARGYVGVDFFFILSGFIITHVYLASLASPSRSAVQIFLWHRFIRLYPVHVTILVILAAMVSLANVAGIVLNKPQEWQWMDLVWHFTMLQAWGVTEVPGWNAPSWSISAEWFAYLLFPLLAPALMRIRTPMIAMWIAGAALAGMVLIFATTHWSLNTWVGAPALTRVFGEFLCGAALFRATMMSRGLPHISGDILGASAFLAFLIAASVGLSDFLLIGLLALTILGAAQSRGFLAWTLGSRPLVWLGEVSYSIYMVHFPVLIAIRRFWERLGIAEWHSAGRIFAFLATIALVVACAAILFHVIERPARTRLRDRMGTLAPA